MYARSIPKSLVSVAAGALFGLSLGCIITTSGGGSDECGSVLSHSHEGTDGMCYCDAGYTWEDPNDDSNFDCDPIEPKDGQCDQPNSYEAGGQCYCDSGYNWCSPSDPNDFSCCLDDAQDTLASGTGDTGDMTATGNDTGSTDTGADSSGDSSVDETGGVSPDPSQCTAETEGTYFCSNTDAMGPENSMMWQCLSGLWNLIGQPDLDALCMFDGYDFAYGCTDDGDMAGSAGPVCGYGPGTACEGDATACETDDLLNYCQFGKLSQSSCLAVCQDPMAKMTYDFGYCAEDPDAMGAFDCFCCDEGDEGCPV
ncbi:MAG TPA: hypothetical protein VG755_40630 [Nannocystaceae bacterium]|nr:hypothetical protein [Nannocystaceae bacterium]